MNKPIKMTVDDYRSSGLKSTDDPSRWLCDVIRNAGYNNGDQVELVKAGRVAELEVMLRRTMEALYDAWHGYGEESDHRNTYDAAEELLEKGGAE